MIGAWFLRLAVLVSVLWLLPMLVIRAQPYDDAAVRTLLQPPEACPSPCFMGIRPGSMTVWDALDVLHMHRWVGAMEDYEFENFQNPDGTVTLVVNWDWSGTQPTLIDPARQGGVWVLDDRIVSIDVETELRLGDVKLSLGWPDREQIYTTRNVQGTFYTHYAWYEQPQILMIVANRCPVTQLDHSRVLLHWAEKAPEMPDMHNPRQACV
ncbi:MAG: hypothetical protein CL610_22020 [Anaerolineaceae bacterium]|nr:hypothetical protein [Anaerolineaceae bacterium]